MVRERERISLPPMDGLMAALKKGAKTFAEAGGEDAYFGDPTAASAEDGESLLRGPRRDPAPVRHGAPRQQGLVPVQDHDPRAVRGPRPGRDRVLPEPRELPPRVVRGLLRRPRRASPTPRSSATASASPPSRWRWSSCRPVHYGDHVDVDVTVEHLGRTSVQIRYEGSVGGQARLQGAQHRGGGGHADLQAHAAAAVAARELRARDGHAGALTSAARAATKSVICATK